MLNACYILHRRAYRESSLLLDVFTYQQGKVSILAKGAYKSKSALSAQLQPFQPLLLDWSGGSNLKTMTKLEAPRPAIKLHGLSLYAAMYINELLYRLLQEGQAMFDLFEAYITALDSLSQVSDVESPLRMFEARLLYALGLMPDLECDWRGNPIDSAQAYYLSGDGHLVSAKGVGIPSESAMSASDLSCLLDILSGAGTFVREDSSESVGRNRAVKGFLRGLIDQALDGRQLQSRELVRQFIKQRQA